jgi:hypothetical protein
MLSCKLGMWLPGRRGGGGEEAQDAGQPPQRVGGQYVRALEI